MSRAPAPKPFNLEPPQGHGHGPVSARSSSRTLKLSLAAIGVVFGDIGTSPLYAMRECFHGPHAIPVNEANVLGVLSLIFWSLTLIVTIKYIAFVLRADNQGEGGILALMALVSSVLGKSKLHPMIIALGVFGATLLYGDGVITPAISVLGAVEGLAIAAPSLEHWVPWLTAAILIGVFSIQRHGTESVGRVFGPVMLVWFATLAVLGISNVFKNPAVLAAASPTYALGFLLENGTIGFIVLGAVVLVVTGGESLYADLGHFGRTPIRRAWVFVVFPGLILNYFGQGALLLRDASAAEHPFFHLFPQWALYPGVALSAVAAVIASQALISGVYSITRQGTMLGFLPRANIRHTSADERGQIYVPTVNWMLMLGTLALVGYFQSSSRLAAAYGIAVTLTMIITTIMMLFLVRTVWGWSLPRVVLFGVICFVPEVLFLLSSSQKILHGGAFPLLVGALLFALMMTWKRGRDILSMRFREQLLPLTDFFDILTVERPARVPGTAVFMTSVRDGTPPSLLHNFLHNRVVHQHVVLLTILTDDAARIPDDRRITREELDEGFVRIVARYGFMEQPDVPRLLIGCGAIVPSLEGVTFFLGRDTMIATERPGMARWRVHLFAFLARNSQPATKFFQIPPDRVLEIGSQIEL
jgi:KUP system potassium uptake protein